MHKPFRKLEFLVCFGILPLALVCVPVAHHHHKYAYMNTAKAAWRAVTPRV